MTYFTGPFTRTAWFLKNIKGHSNYLVFLFHDVGTLTTDDYKKIWSKLKQQRLRYLDL